MRYFGHIFIDFCIGKQPVQNTINKMLDNILKVSSQRTLSIVYCYNQLYYKYSCLYDQRVKPCSGFQKCLDMLH
jgi:hypothetical protein